MTNLNELLTNLDACDPAKQWATNKSWNEIYTTCDRGNWLLWLFARTNPDDLQLLTLAAGHCANTVRHLMKDDRSLAAVDGTIAYGEGRITFEQLAVLRIAAATAAASHATTTAAGYAANAASYADNAVYYAYKKNQRLTADICRKYLPIGCWNITKE